MPSSRQASAPVDGGDGGLVYMSASSMFCLSCPHSQVCRHLVLAGGVADRPVMVQEHSEKDQQDYLRLVHASLTADGTRFKCRGDDTPFIVLTETKFSFRCIPVWDRYSPHRTRVEKKTHVIMLSP